MLKTGGPRRAPIPPSSHSHAQIAGHRERRVDLEADGGVQAPEVEQAVAGDVREPVDRGAAAQQREHRRDVDRGRREQRLADARAAERGRALVETTVGEAPGERVAVRVQAARRQADQHVPGRAALAGDEASSATVPIAVPESSSPPGEGWPRIMLGEHRELAAGDLDSGELGAAR